MISVIQKKHKFLLIPSIILLIAILMLVKFTNNLKGTSDIINQSIDQRNVFANTASNKPHLIMSSALRAEYSSDGKKILFFSKKPNGKYAIFFSYADGKNKQCLTCSLTEFNDVNVGQASWHPSMKYIAFQVEKSTHIAFPGSDALTHPGIGWFSDIYVMRLSDKKLLKVTNLPTKKNILDRIPLTAVLHPHFSKDGNKISWGQSSNLTRTGWSNWEVALADFKYDNTKFSIDKLMTLKPKNNNGYYESDDFSSDGKNLLLSGNLDNPNPKSMDVYAYNIENMSLKRLTNSTDWDETPIYSPDNSRIVWLSSRGFNFSLEDSTPWWKNGKTEAWIMDSNGANPRQITFFNTPGTKDYDFVGGKRTFVHYIEWYPDGKKLLVSMGISNEPRPGFTEKIISTEIE